MHLALARAERRPALGRAACCAVASRLARRGIAPQSLVDRVEQLLLAVGLLHEIDRAVLDRLDRHRDVAVAADEDDRDARAHGVQPLLQRQAAHARHAHVQHQAAAPLGVEGLEEIDAPS